jgi:hypothetical protein
MWQIKPEKMRAKWHLFKDLTPELPTDLMAKKLLETSV